MKMRIRDHHRRRRRCGRAAASTSATAAAALFPYSVALLLAGSLAPVASGWSGAGGGGGIFASPRISRPLGGAPAAAAPETTASLRHQGGGRCHRQIATTTTICLAKKKRDSEDGEEDDEDEDEPSASSSAEEDWRAFRAKLVMQEKSEQKSKSDDSKDAAILDVEQEGEGGAESAEAIEGKAEAAERSMEASAPATSSGGWIYESGDVIERGSLIVSRPKQDFGFGGLRQQYFHKCVVLVTQHDATFTKGVILNRPSSAFRTDPDGVCWHVQFGGDVQGATWLPKSQEEVLCLHRLKNSPVASEMSETVVGDIQVTSWEMARDLVEKGEATPEDFWVGSGYCGWGPNQLQGELDRGGWYMVATDSETIFDLIVDQPTDLDPDADITGIKVWENLIRKIGKEHLINDVDTFEDEMLKEWVKVNLYSDEVGSGGVGIKPGNGSEDKNKKDNTASLNKKEKMGFPAGAVVRSKAPFVLDNQILHESLLVILKDDVQCTIGLVLNRPMPDSIPIRDSLVPVRYGGKYGLLNMSGKPEFWFHCNNAALRAAKVGVPIDGAGGDGDEGEGGGSGSGSGSAGTIWKCTQDDAETAVKMGIAKASDFLVVSGLSLWNKNPDIVITREELDFDSFEVVPAEKVPVVWDLLTKQSPLSVDTVTANLEVATAAWKVSAPYAGEEEGEGRSNGKPASVEDDDTSSRLASQALEKWMKAFLGISSDKSAM